MDEHDWPAVLSAIECLLKTSQEDEPNAVNFHAAMVNALLEGRKNQTRRLIENQECLDAIEQHPKELSAIASQKHLLPIRVGVGDMRITLKVTDVRIERLQGISEDDAKSEGLLHYTDGAGWDWWSGSKKITPCGCPIEAFQRLWNSINGPDA